MKKRVTLFVASALLLALTAVGCEKKREFGHRSPNNVISLPSQALQMLKDGNERFVNNELMPRTTNLADRKILAEGQWPFAVVITCSDSRVSPELFFDQKQGDLFVIRNAGNIADATALGSMEFAVEHLGASLVAVVGHTGCGAVINAHAGAQGLSSNLQSVLDRVAENITDSENAQAAKVDNVRSVIAAVSANEVVQKTQAKVVGAIFDVSTGAVTFLE